MTNIEKKHVCEELRAIRQDLGLSMDKMAKVLGYEGASGYQYYEDKKLYKREFFENSFIAKLIERLTPLGISTDRIESLGLPVDRPHALTDTDAAIIYVLNDIIKMLLDKKNPITKERFRKDFIFALDHYQSERSPGAIAVMNEILACVEGPEIPAKPRKVERLLRLSPPG